VSLIPSKKIDLVLVSQSIPVATCLQLCKVIRQNPDYQNMPFLVISSNENFFERAKAKMAGVTDYLSQPLDRTKILYALDSHLK
jgi:twitching motility two-component system response regulator PilG